MNQFNKEFGAVISAVVVTALVVGGVVYKTQKARIDGLQNKIQSLNNKVSELEKQKNKNQVPDEKQDENNQDNNQVQGELSTVSLEESGLKFDLCELPLEKGREDDWRYVDIFNEKNPKPACLIRQEKSWDAEDVSQETNLIIQGNFLYRTDSKAITKVRSLYDLEKIELSDANKFKQELKNLQNKEYDFFDEKYGEELGQLILKYTKDNNAEVVKTFVGDDTVDTPNHGLKIINGKVSWEFDGAYSYETEIKGEMKEFSFGFSTVVYDGQNLIDNYPVLDAVYKLGSINKRLLFIAKEKNKYFIVYGGKKVSKEFDEINTFGCCSNSEPVWSGERLTFRARIGNKGYSVVVLAK